MTCNPCSGGSCWGKASKQRADPGPSTEVGLVPSPGSAGKWTFPAELWNHSGGLFFSTLSLEYSVFTHGNLQGKHHSGSYQRIMSGITFPEALELKDKATSLMADDSCGFLEASASGVRWIFPDFQIFNFFLIFFKFLLLWLYNPRMGWKGY